MILTVEFFHDAVSKPMVNQAQMPKTTGITSVFIGFSHTEKSYKITVTLFLHEFGVL